MKNILILEDNKAHMKALVKMLSEINDIKIFEAYNLAKANYMLSFNSFDIFLVDIILDTKASGDVSGLDFVNEIRNHKKYQYTPVIFITSLEDPKLVAYKELHCYNYIEKPFDPQEVIKTVKEAMKIPISFPQKEYAYFRKDGIVYSVKVDEVVYIAVSRKGTEIHTVRDCLRLGYKSISDLLNVFDSINFVKCSRSTIINKKYVEFYDITNGYLKLKGIENVIEMGIVMKKQFKKMT